MNEKNDVKGSQVFSGKEGELWLDGVKVGQCTKCRAEVQIEYEDVSVNKKFMKDRKMTGADTDGEIEFLKINSMMTLKMHEYISQRKMPLFTIIAKIDDPDAIGAERIALYNCTFDKMILADWENGSLSKENYKFKFTDYDLIDTAM